MIFLAHATSRSTDFRAPRAIPLAVERPRQQDVEQNHSNADWYQSGLARHQLSGAFGWSNSLTIRNMQTALWINSGVWSMYLGLRCIHKNPHCVVYHLIITFIFNTSITASIKHSNSSISFQLLSSTSNIARPAVFNRATILSITLHQH